MFYNKAPVSGIELVSFFSQSGLHGEVHFMESPNDPGLVKVKAFLETTIQYPEQSWSWGIHQNPIDYLIVDPVKRCDLEHVGPQIMTFDDVFGYLLLPGNESSVWDDVKLNLTGELIEVFFLNNELTLSGCVNRRKRSLGQIAGDVQRWHRLSHLLHIDNQNVVHWAYRRGEI